MKDRQLGDEAVKKLAAEFKEIINLKSTVKDRIDKMTSALQAAVLPWNIKGDDRVLGEMTIEAGAALEQMVDNELSNVKILKTLKSDVDNIPWLADGFKSSIKVKIAIAVSKVL
jgi:hypothetical protein